MGFFYQLHGFQGAGQTFLKYRFHQTISGAHTVKAIEKVQNLDIDVNRHMKAAWRNLRWNSMRMMFYVSPQPRLSKLILVPIESTSD